MVHMLPITYACNGVQWSNMLCVSTQQVNCCDTNTCGGVDSSWRDQVPAGMPSSLVFVYVLTLACAGMIVCVSPSAIMSVSAFLPLYQICNEVDSEVAIALLDQ